MTEKIYSLIPAQHLQNVLKALQGLTGIPTRLISAQGQTLLLYGEEMNYCEVLKRNLFSQEQCMALHKKSGYLAQRLGEAYIYTCHANLNIMTFPLINQEELLGSVVVGPFLLGEPDSTVLSGVAEQHQLTPTLSLELYDELLKVPSITTERAGYLQKIVNYLLSPLIPSERAALIQTKEKAIQQSKINETIQNCKERGTQPSLLFFHQKEKELLLKVRTGSVPEVKGILNELIGYTLFSEGGRMQSMRIRAIELTTLLSRVAIDGGADTENIYDLNSKFLTLIYQEQDLNDLCILLQDVAESFMNFMFYQKDKGNSCIRKALRFIAENFYEHLDLNAVADFVQLSPSYLSTLFHQTVGTNFREYLCNVRVEESKRLLLTTEYSLADIALSVGFPDQSYFCKVFRRIVGVSPGKYRAAPVTVDDEKE